MRRTLSVARRLQRDGAVWPVPVLSAHDARAMRSRLVVELSGVKDFKKSDLLYYKSHLVFGVVDELARHPAIVAAAQDALCSRDLILWDSSVPLKPAAATAPQHFPWHQDATYWGLDPADGAVSCWVALSDASRAHGCMRVLRGSHAEGQRPHALRPADPGSMLRRGQQVDGVDESAAEAMALRAGEMSLHHPWALHCSGPNSTADDRVGVVLVYASPSTAPHNGRGSATLIAGRCDAEHWVLSSRRPAAHGAVADAAALEEHAQALALHRGDLRASRPT